MANKKRQSDDETRPLRFWWNTPYGWSDAELFDYNNNQVLEDNEITDIIKDNFADDPLLPISDENRIQVEVRDGVVTLSGEVRHPRSKVQAYLDAFWSAGVVDVVNNIKIKARRMRESEE